MWIIDEADRVFPCTWKNDLFGPMRSWHNDRSFLAPNESWNRVKILMAYATDSHLITDQYQSPFNVGTKVNLGDFTLAQVEDLNRRYGSPLQSAGLGRLYSLINGHPYLTRKVFFEMTSTPTPVTIEDLEMSLEKGQGLFSDHLERLWLTLSQDVDLVAALQGYFREPQFKLPHAQLVRLCAGGVMISEDDVHCRPRNTIYERFLQRRLQ